MSSKVQRFDKCLIFLCYILIHITWLRNLVAHMIIILDMLKLWLFPLLILFLFLLLVLFLLMLMFLLIFLLLVLSAILLYEGLVLIFGCYFCCVLNFHYGCFLYSILVCVLSWVISWVISCAFCCCCCCCCCYWLWLLACH